MKNEKQIRLLCKTGHRIEAMRQIQNSNLKMGLHEAKEWVEKNFPLSKPPSATKMKRLAFRAGTLNMMEGINVSLNHANEFLSDTEILDLSVKFAAFAKAVLAL